MKKKFLLAISLILTLLSFNSCKTTLVSDNDFLPQILNPTIESYNYGTEKGYKVSFKLDKSDFKPVGVVVYKIKQNIAKSGIKENGRYEVNVIHQTQKLHNFTPKAFEQPNGVLFLIDGTYFLKKVDFKKIKNK